MDKQLTPAYSEEARKAGSKGQFAYAIQVMNRPIKEVRYRFGLALVKIRREINGLNSIFNPVMEQLLSYFVF